MSYDEVKNIIPILKNDYAEEIYTFSEITECLNYFCRTLERFQESHGYKFDSDLPEYIKDFRGQLERVHDLELELLDTYNLIDDELSAILECVRDEMEQGINSEGEIAEVV